MKGLEPSTFCMASRRSSQLSYIREARRESSGRIGFCPPPRRGSAGHRALRREATGVREGEEETIGRPIFGIATDTALGDADEA